MSDKDAHVMVSTDDETALPKAHDRRAESHRSVFNAVGIALATVLVRAIWWITGNLFAARIREWLEKR